jgi:hypothetical protein
MRSSSLDPSVTFQSKKQSNDPTGKVSGSAVRSGDKRLELVMSAQDYEHLEGIKLETSSPSLSESVRKALKLFFLVSVKYKGWEVQLVHPDDKRVVTVEIGL